MRLFDRAKGLALICALGATVVGAGTASADPGFDVTGMGVILSSQNSTPMRAPLTYPGTGGTAKLCVVRDAVGRAVPEAGNPGLSRCRHTKTNAVLTQNEGGHAMWWFPQTNVYTWKAAPNGVLPAGPLRLANQTPCRARLANTAPDTYAIGKVVPAAGKQVCQHPAFGSGNRTINAQVFEVVARK